MDATTSTDMAQQSNIIDLATDIVAAYVSNNSVPASELPALISGIHAAIAGLGSSAVSPEPKAEKLTPGQIRKSITHDALISFEDAKPYKTLKRHPTKLGITPDEYRSKWGLPRDYPLVAASYSETRSALAKSLGLGQQRRNAAPKVADVNETIAEAPKARGRKKAAESTQKPTRGRKLKAATAE